MTTPPVVSITDDLLAELEQLAGKATPGPWRYSKSNCEIGVVDQSDTQSNGMMLAIGHIDAWDFKDQHYANGELIARANPATILALLAHIADLKLQLAAASVDAERYDWLREMHNDEYGCLWVSHWDYGQVDWVSLDAFYRPSYDGELDLDASIDAARNIGSGD